MLRVVYGPWPYTFERESSEVSCLLFGLEVAACCPFKSWNASSRPLMCFLCAPTGKIGAQTSASTHFLAKEVSALGSSLPIGDMKGNTSRFSQRCCLQRALLAYRPPALDKIWRGRGRAFKRPRQKLRVETRGSLFRRSEFPCKRKPVVRPSPAPDQRRQVADE